MRKEILSDTDEPSLESRVVDNVVAVLELLLMYHLDCGSRSLPTGEVANSIGLLCRWEGVCQHMIVIAHIKLPMSRSWSR